MAIRRIFAADMRNALREIRDCVGPDATILQQQRVAGGVEVLVDDGLGAVASDTASKGGAPLRRTPLSVNEKQMLDEALSQTRAKIMTPSQSVRPKQLLGGQPQPQRAANSSVARPAAQYAQMAESSTVKKTNSAPVDEAGSDELTMMRSELKQMRDLLQQQLGDMAWGQFNRRSPVQAKLWRKLSGMGLSPKLCERLVEKGSEQSKLGDAWKQVLGELSGLLHTPRHDLVARGGVFALVGPTGSGKTTTISKLATRFVLEHGADQVGLITTDTYRLGAYEQLQGLARILSVPLSLANNQDELQSALDNFSGKKLILIDTAGLQPSSREHKLQLAMLEKVRPMVRSLLVLPCTSQCEVLQAAYHCHSRTRLAGLVLTRTDEALQLGGALSVAIRYQLPISYICDGQLIPENIAQARRHQLISQAVSLGRATPENDQGLIDDYAGVLASRSTNVV